MKAVSLNLDIFLKNFMVKPLLGIEKIKYCGLCEKVVLSPNEISEKEKDSLVSVCCSRCRMYYHLGCLKITLSDVDEWFCSLCITSMMDEPNEEL